MERRALGRSGLTVPAVGVGTWRTFDVATPAEQAGPRAVVDAALAAGADLFDSSPMYGRAERVLGAALAGRRERSLVATKVWTPDDDEAERQINRSLAHFGGLVDVYQVHNLVAWPTRLARLERLRDEGRVGAIGVTHYQHAAIPELMEIMRSGRVASVQVPYNALDQAVRMRLLPLAADLGVGVIVMRPLGEGALTARAPTAEQLAALAPFGIESWAQALLKWILSDRRVSSAIPATSDAGHARDNAAAGAPPWFGPDERAHVARLAAQLAG
jgi:aryl-alcohol dehydrogenase-like predicted oxidoreductase